MLTMANSFELFGVNFGDKYIKNILLIPHLVTKLLEISGIIFGCASQLTEMLKRIASLLPIMPVQDRFDRFFVH